METPKKPRCEVEGFIHKVSPVLKSRSGEVSYFSAVFQEATRNSRVVVFDIQRHNQFQCVEKDKSPVKLSDVVLSKSSQGKEKIDIKFNSRSKMSVVQKLSFAFDQLTGEGDQKRTLEEILQDVREYQRVSVKVKVLQLLSQKQTVTRSRQRLTQTTYTVADQAKTIPLTVWGNHSLVVGSWYELTDVSVRLFNQKACLTTTVDTTLSIVDDCGSSAELEEGARESIVGEIVDTEVKIQNLCPQFHPLEFVNLETNMTRCENCRAFCKTSKVSSLLRGHITVEIGAQNKKIPMDHDHFCKLLDLPKRGRYDSNELVSKVLGYDKLRIEMCGEVLINVQFADNAPEKSMCEVRSSSEPVCHKHEQSDVQDEKDSVPCTSAAMACALSSSQCGDTKAVNSDVQVETDSVPCTSNASACALSSVQCDVHSEKDSVVSSDCTTESTTNEKEGVGEDNFDDIDLDLEEVDF